MKNIKQLAIFIASSYLFVGCAVQSAGDYFGYTDYTRYQRDGFFVSSIDDYSGSKYTALGDIELIATESTDAFGKSTKRQSAQVILDKMVAEAKKRGANGLIGFKSTRHSPSNGYPYHHATGVAILFEESPVAAPESEMPASSQQYAQYDFSAAQAKMNNGEPLMSRTESDIVVYYDPDTNQYLSASLFTQKYGQKVFMQLQSMTVVTGSDLVNKTIQYVLVHDMRPIKYIDGVENVFDINVLEYINWETYYEKYGEENFKLLKEQYKEAKRQIRESKY